VPSDELRGEKIDIIEWSDEPSVFAANALSPAKVSQVRITDINNRQMEVIVGEDQLSLAIGKKGQNVRLATRLVGWDIKIVSEELLKKEIAKQMGRMMASGEAVPLTALEVVSAPQAEVLAGKGIEDVESLAATSVDDLVDFLDISLDEAEKIRTEASAIVEARNAEIEPAGEETPGEAQTDAEVTESDEAAAETAETAPAESDEQTGTAESDIEVPADDSDEAGTETSSAEVSEVSAEDEPAKANDVPEASVDVTAEAADESSAEEGSPDESGA
jgi:N utilization substance protein A